MFRFTIRDVLWLTVVVALALGWWIERTSLSASRLAIRVRAIDLQTALSNERERQRLEGPKWSMPDPNSGHPMGEGLYVYPAVDWSLVDKPLPK